MSMLDHIITVGIVGSCTVVAVIAISWFKEPASEKVVEAQAYVSGVAVSQKSAVGSQLSTNPNVTGSADTPSHSGEYKSSCTDTVRHSPAGSTTQPSDILES